MIKYFLFTFLFTLSCVSVNAQVPETKFMGYTISEDMTGRCLSGDCENGKGILFTNYGFTGIDGKEGTFKGYGLNGPGTQCHYHSYSYGRQLRPQYIRQGMFVKSLLAEGTYCELNLATADTIDIARGTLDDAFFPYPAEVHKGTETFYPRVKPVVNRCVKT